MAAMTMPVRPVRVRAGIVEDFILTINFAICVMDLSLAVLT